MILRFAQGVILGEMTHTYRPDKQFPVILIGLRFYNFHSIAEETTGKAEPALSLTATAEHTSPPRTRTECKQCSGGGSVSREAVRLGAERGRSPRVTPGIVTTGV